MTTTAPFEAHKRGAEMEVINLKPHIERAAKFNRLVKLLGTDEDRERFNDYIESKIMSEGKRIFTTNEVAELLVVNPETVRRWIRGGELVAHLVGRSNRIERAELERFWRAKGGGQLFSDSPTGGANNE